jgi:hypothetical protein
MKNAVGVFPQCLFLVAQGVIEELHTRFGSFFFKWGLIELIEEMGKTDKGKVFFFGTYHFMPNKTK